MLFAGGAIYTAGNISPLAEANFALDAGAAALVARAFQPADAAPFVLAPLDMTHQAMITAADLDTMAARGGEGVGMYTRAARGYQKFYCERAGMCNGSPQHDAHAVAYVVDPEMYTNSSWMQLEVPPPHPLAHPHLASPNHILLSHSHLASAPAFSRARRSSSASQARQRTACLSSTGAPPRGKSTRTSRAPSPPDTLAPPAPGGRAARGCHPR